MAANFDENPSRCSMLKLCELRIKFSLGGTYRVYIGGYRGTYSRTIITTNLVQGSRHKFQDTIKY